MDCKRFSYVEQLEYLVVEQNKTIHTQTSLNIIQIPRNNYTLYDAYAEFKRKISSFWHVLYTRRLEMFSKPFIKILCSAMQIFFIKKITELYIIFLYIILHLQYVCHGVKSG